MRFAEADIWLGGGCFQALAGEAAPQGNDLHHMCLWCMWMWYRPKAEQVIVTLRNKFKSFFGP